MTLVNLDFDGLIITKRILFHFTLLLCCAHQTSMNRTSISFAFGIRLVGFSWSVSLLSLPINQTLTRRSNINTAGHTRYKSIHNRLALAGLFDPLRPPERTPWTQQQPLVVFPTASAYLTNVFFILCIPHQRLLLSNRSEHMTNVALKDWAVCGLW